MSAHINPQNLFFPKPTKQFFWGGKARLYSLRKNRNAQLSGIEVKGI